MWAQFSYKFLWDMTDQLWVSAEVKRGSVVLVSSTAFPATVDTRCWKAAKIMKFILLIMIFILWHLKIYSNLPTHSFWLSYPSVYLRPESQCKQPILLLSILNRRSWTIRLYHTRQLSSWNWCPEEAMECLLTNRNHVTSIVCKRTAHILHIYSIYGL